MSLEAVVCGVLLCGVSWLIGYNAGCESTLEDIRRWLEESMKP